MRHLQSLSSKLTSDVASKVHWWFHITGHSFSITCYTRNSLKHNQISPTQLDTYPINSLKHNQITATIAISPTQLDAYPAQLLINVALQHLYIPLHSNRDVANEHLVPQSRAGRIFPEHVPNPTL